MCRLVLILTITLVLSIDASAEVIENATKQNIVNNDFRYKAVAALPRRDGGMTVVFEIPSMAVPNCSEPVCIGLWRFDANGQKIDLAAIATPASLTKVTAAAVDNFGRIVVIGTAKNLNSTNLGFGVVRFAESMALDLTFGVQGKQRIDFDLGDTNADIPNALAIDRNNNIVVAGSVAVGFNNTDFGAVRLLGSNGQPDTGFGGIGTGRTRILFDLNGANPDQANGVAIGNDGKIVLGGIAWDSAINQNRPVLAQLNADGTTDSSFCPNANACTTGDLGFNSIYGGRLVYFFGSHTPEHADEIAAVDVAGNGDIVIAGTTFSANSVDKMAAVALFNANGAYLAETVQPGIDNNARFRSVRFVDALGNRVIAAGDVLNGVRVSNANSFMVQAFGPYLTSIPNYGNCLTNHNAICFIGELTEYINGSFPENTASLSLDSLGRPLFAGTYGGYGLYYEKVVAVRITNNSGPKPDPILRDGFGDF